MLKKLLFLVACFMLITNVCYAKMLTQGTKELDIEGSYDDHTAAGESFWTAIGFGYFIVDNLEVCIAGAFIYNDLQTGYHPALGLQYNIDLGGKLVPFIGGNIGWGIWNNKNTEDVDAFVYGVEAGLKYFLAENVALSGAVDYDWATDNLWDEEDGTMNDKDLSIHFGLRYYFQ